MKSRLRARSKPVLLVLGLLFLLCILFLVAIGLSYQTYMDARGPLQSAQDTLTAVAHNPNALDSSYGRNLTEIRLAQAQKDIVVAQRDITSSLGLKILGVIPGLHAQRAGLEQLLTDLQQTTIISRSLLSSVSTLAAQSHGTTVSLPALRTFGSALASARLQLSSEERSTAGLWGPVGAYRQKFDQEDARAVHLVSQGQGLVRYALPFLGGNGPRTYLVVGENNAEMRDQGAVLSYSLMHTLNGSINESAGGSAADIELSSPVPGVAIPAGTEAAFGHLDPTELWPSTNATADFPFSGRTMQAMFATAVGTHVNGVIGLDAVALQGLLALTGPLTVPGLPQPITAQNATYVLLNQLYQGLPPGSSQSGRREQIAAVTSAVFNALHTGNGDIVALARTVADSVSTRHLQVWDENPGFEKTIRDVGASGAADAVDPSRTFHIALENATATKLDYFVQVSVADTIYLTSDGTAYVDTAVRVSNGAPSGPASYQLGPDGINSRVPGQYVGRVLVWGPRGSSQHGSVPESGLRVTEEDLGVLPGQAATAQFTTSIRGAVQGGNLRLVFVPQPRLSPESVSVQVVEPNGTKLPPTHVLLTKTTQLRWNVAQ